MTATYQELGRTNFSGRASAHGSTEGPVLVRILTVETEAPHLLRQHVMTQELAEQSIATAKTADGSRFRPWADVRDALRTRNT